MALANDAAVVAFDGDGAIVFWSRSAGELFGYDAPEMLGHRIAELIDGGVLPDDAEQRVVGIRKDRSTFAAVVALERWEPAEQPPAFCGVFRTAFRGVFRTVDAEPDAATLQELYLGVTRLLAESETFEAMAGPLLEQIATALAWDAGGVWLFDPARRLLRCSYFWSASEAPEVARFRRMTMEMRVPLDFGLVGRVWSTGEARWLDDPSEDPDFLRAAEATDAGFHAALAFPITNGRDVTGVLEFYSARRRPLDAELLRIMEQLGVQIGVYRDREQSQAAYRELVRRFNDAQRFAHVGTFELNLVDGTNRWSDELYRLMGIAPQSRQVSFDEAVAHVVEAEREEVRSAVARATATGEPVDMKCTVVREDDGRERVFRVRARLGDGDEPPYRFIGSVLDVTADEEAERERMTLQRELDETRRISSLGQLAATMAHEFNNVLHAIDNISALVLRRGVEPATESAVHNIQTALRRGRAITDEILRFTSGSQPLLAPLDVRKWLDAFLPEAQALAGWRVSVDVREPFVIRGDVSQLNQALVNLVINARDASPRDAPIVICARRPSPELGGGNGNVVDIVVSDRGSGIPPHLRDRVFEPLFTTKRTGTGLGLAVVHQVVRSHAGSIRVRSEVGKGTEFHLLFPALDRDTAAETRMPSRVLLVEDEESVAIGIREVLAFEDIQVRIVWRGEDVIPALETELPEVLVLDIGLPGISGTEVYEAVAQRWPSLPAIFISGHYTPAEIEEHLLHPHVAFLRKPFEIEQLLNALSCVAVAAG